MNRRRFLSHLSRFSLGAAALRASAAFGQESSPPPAGSAGRVKTGALPLVDAARGRAVPVVLYEDAATGARPARLAVFSPGYGMKPTEYSFLANHLAARGWGVASIQHELPDDEPLPKVGKPYEARMPSWQRGVQNILFVLGELKRARPDLDQGRPLLIGHSHGGDTSMLFARVHPDRVDLVLSLDNRRMPLPRTARPRLCSLRSSDQPADEGVLPTPEEQAKLGIKVVRLPATRHDDMWDGATPAQKAEMLGHLDEFLREG